MKETRPPRITTDKPAPDRVASPREREIEQIDAEKTPAMEGIEVSGSERYASEMAGLPPENAYVFEEDTTERESTVPSPEETTEDAYADGSEVSLADDFEAENRARELGFVSARHHELAMDIARAVDRGARAQEIQDLVEEIEFERLVHGGTKENVATVEEFEEDPDEQQTYISASKKQLPERTAPLEVTITDSGDFDEDSSNVLDDEGMPEISEEEWSSLPKVRSGGRLKPVVTSDPGATEPLPTGIMDIQQTREQSSEEVAGTTRNQHAEDLLRRIRARQQGLKKPEQVTAVYEPEEGEEPLLSPDDPEFLRDKNKKKREERNAFARREGFDSAAAMKVADIGDAAIARLKYEIENGLDADSQNPLSDEQIYERKVELARDLAGHRTLFPDLYGPDIDYTSPERRGVDELVDDIKRTNERLRAKEEQNPTMQSLNRELRLLSEFRKNVLIKGDVEAKHSIKQLYDQLSIASDTAEINRLVQASRELRNELAGRVEGARLAQNKEIWELEDALARVVELNGDQNDIKTLTNLLNDLRDARNPEEISRLVEDSRTIREAIEQAYP